MSINQIMNFSNSKNETKLSNPSPLVKQNNTPIKNAFIKHKKNASNITDYKNKKYDDIIKSKDEEIRTLNDDIKNTKLVLEEIENRYHELEEKV